MSVLSDIVARVERTPGAVVVFDLDATLFSNQPRNHSILKEFVAMVGAPEDLHRVVQALAPSDMGWNVVDDLRRRGFSHEATLQRLRAFWRERFFRDEYLRHDIPLPGAVRFVTDLFAAGATIFYLTGRDEPGMGSGTRRSLTDHGFPLVHERVFLRLKPRFDLEDYAFKRDVLDEIRALGEVVAAFENEPANANMFAQAFPTAHVVLLDTIHSPNAPPPLPHIVLLPDFER